MSTYRFTALMTISVFTEVEADSEDEALEIAKERGTLGMTHQPFDGDAGDGWLCDELDGEPVNITNVKD